MPTPAEIAAALVAREEMPPEQGDIGPQGLTGPQGDTGPEGPEGPQGPVGVQGPEGQQGIQGPKGDLGSRGPKGDKGDKGDPGRDGAPGANGRGYNVRGLASGMVIDNQGSQLNQGKVVGEVDFAGAGVSTAITGGRAVVTIPGGGGGGGLTLEDVLTTGNVTGDHAIVGADTSDGSGASLLVSGAALGHGGEFRLDSGDGAAGHNAGGAVVTAGTGDDGNGGGGGSLLLIGGKADGNAGAVTVSAGVPAFGSGLDGGALNLQAGAGDGAGSPGRVQVRTNGSTGTMGQLFTADGAGGSTWEDPGVGGAAPTLAQVLAAGNDPNGVAIQGATIDSALGGAVTVGPATGGGDGGSITLQSGTGLVAAGGGYVDIIASGGDNGNTASAEVFLHGGTATDPGYVLIKTLGSTGSGTQFLGSDGASHVIWRNPAAAVADIPDPSSATAEDVANKINELMGSLRTAGLLAA